MSPDILPFMFREASFILVLALLRRCVGWLVSGVTSRLLLLVGGGGPGGSSLWCARSPFLVLVVRSSEEDHLAVVRPGLVVSRCEGTGSLALWVACGPDPGCRVLVLRFFTLVEVNQPSGENRNR